MDFATLQDAQDAQDERGSDELIHGGFTARWGFDCGHLRDYSYTNAPFFEDRGETYRDFAFVCSELERNVRRLQQEGFSPT